MEKQILKRISSLEKKVVDLYHKVKSTGTSSSEEGVKVAKVTITQADILNPAGFSKLLVSPVAGKILIPTSVAIYRKPGGTNYTILNSVRVTSLLGTSTASTIGNAIDAPFLSATESTTFTTLTSSSNAAVTPGNSLKLISGSSLAPSVITGGTGALVLVITYQELSPN